MYFAKKLRLERDIKLMYSSPFQELHDDVQLSLLHFLTFYSTTTKKKKIPLITPSYERQEKHTPTEKMQMKDCCFQTHHGK